MRVRDESSEGQWAHLVGGGFGDEVALFDEIEAEFGVQEVGAGQAAEVVGEARHLGRRAQLLVLGAGQRHVVAQHRRHVDAVADVVDQVLGRRLVAGARVQTAIHTHTHTHTQNGHVENLEEYLWLGQLRLDEVISG